MNLISRSFIFTFLLSFAAFSQSNWNQLNTANSPSARQGHSMGTLPDGKVLLFGGEGPQEDLFNDLYIFQEIDWQEVEPSGDKPRPRRDAASWIIENIFYIHGGKGNNGEIFDDMWTYDSNLNKWEEVEQGQVNPGTLTRHSATALDDGTVLITAGLRGENTYSFKTYLYDPADNTFEQKQDIPFPSSEQSLMSNGEEAFPVQVFGENQEMVFYTSDNWNYYLPTDPYPGLMASGAYCDAGENGMYALGGEEYHDGVGYENSKKSWKFDPEDKSWSEIAALPGFILHSSAVYDPTGDRILIFGGKDENGTLLNSLYEYPFSPTSVNEDALKNNFVFEQNYPNPFNPTTNIRFQIAKSAHVVLNVFDVLGRELKTLLNDQLSPGEYEIDFDGSALPSGVYFYKLVTDEFYQVKKMVLSK